MMWEVHYLLDAAVPAAIGVSAAGATYYVTDRIRHRRDKATDATRLQTVEHLRTPEKARAVELETKFDPERALRKLQEYRERDPEFRHAIANFVEAEATNADPVEGVPLREHASQPGPVQSKIREMLGV